MARLIILMGLPGCGKSTYAKEYLKDHSKNTIWCSSDQIRKELYGDENIQGNAQKVFKTLHNAVSKYLKNGYNVIYDATNVNRKNRKSIIAIGKTIGVDIHGVIIWASIEECIMRDMTRDRTVGTAVIDKFIKRWESPYYDEGFDSLEIIYNTNIIPYCYMLDLEGSMKIPHENPHHSLGIWEHCEEAANLMSDEDPYDSNMCFIMQWHDCGKPYTKFFKYDENGKKIPHAHYYSHNNVGGYLIYGAWAGLETECLDKILFTSWAITNHMEPFFNSKYYQNMNTELKRKIDLIHKCDKEAH